MELDLGLVARLLNAYVHRPGNLAKFVHQTRSHFPVFDLIAANYLDVKRRGQTEIDRLAHNVRRQKIKCRPGKIVVQAEPQAPHILGRGPMSLIQRDQDVRVIRPGDAAVTVAKVNPRIRQTNVIKDAVEFFRGDLTANVGFDLINLLGGLLDAGTAPSPRVQTERSRVNRREKILAEKRNEQAGPK